jgi:serine/threonine protein kinase
VELILLHCGAGLEYLHSAGIMHCDLKPANVLLKSTASNSRGFTCKLCDFGMSRLLDVRQATHVSTLTYGVGPAVWCCMHSVACRQS